MAVVKVKRPWTRLPPNPRIDSANPDTQGLIFACYFPVAKNLINNRSASTTQPVNTSLFGPGMETVSGAGTEEIIFPDHPDLDIVTEYTILWMGKRTGIEGTAPGMISKRAGSTDFELFFNSSNILFFGSDNGFPDSGLTGGSDGDFIRAGCSNDAAAFDFFLKINNGDFQTSSVATNDAFLSTATMGIGTIQPGVDDNHLYAVHHSVLIWNRKVPEQAIRRIYESNGLSLLVPRTVSIFIPAAVGDLNLTPGVVSLDIATQAAIANLTLNLDPATAVLDIARQAATVQFVRTIAATLATLDIASQSPIANITREIVPALVELDIAAINPVISGDLDLAPLVVALDIVAQTPVVNATRNLAPSTVALDIARQAATVQRVREIVALLATLNIQAFDPIVTLAGQVGAAALARYIGVLHLVKGL